MHDVWGDIALWFFVGLLAASVITVLIPQEMMGKFLGGGPVSMGIMLVVGIPLYICATASTPVAAALILKGVSPGAALVFLLVGPATNITSLSVLFEILGKKSTFRYLCVLSLAAVLFGLATDALYAVMEISPQAVIGEAAEFVPYPVKLASTGILLALSIRPFSAMGKKIFAPKSRGTEYLADFPDLRGGGR